MKQALQTSLSWWSAWASVSVNRRILSASLTVGALTFLVHVVTAAKELVVAHQFGTTDALDAFLIAFLLPSFAISVIAGSLPSAVIPTYLEVQGREGHEAAERLYAAVMSWSLVVLVGATFLMALLAPVVLPLLGSGFEEKKLALTRSLYFATLPILVLKGLATMWGAKLNVAERFSLASVVPILTPLLIVFALLKRGSEWGGYALVAGTVVGGALEAVMLAWYLHRLGDSLTPRWNGWTPALRQVMSQYGPGVAGSVLMAGTMLVDQAMAAMLGAGSVSALSYGGKVASFVVAIGGTALGTAMLPHFSRMVSAADWQGVRHTLRTYVTLILAITIPLTVLAVQLSEPLVGVLYQRGAFTAEDTHVVGRVQAFLLMQVPLYLAGIVIVRLISALKANYVLMWGCILNFIINIVLNYVLMQWLQVAGIALATVVVYMISVMFLAFMLLRVLKERELSLK